MRIAFKNCWLAAAFFALSLGCSFGQPVTFSFSGADIPVWDLTGSYSVSQNMQGAGGKDVPLSYSISITNDPSGRLRGSDLTFLTVGSDTVAAKYTVSGSVSGGGTATKVTMTVRLKGEDTIGGVVTRFNISITYHLEVSEGALSGNSRGHASFSKLGSAKVNDDAFSLPLPPGMDGSWSLQLNILAVTPLGGSGSIVLSNGKILPTSLTGHSASGRSEVRLTGINEGKGCRLNVVFFDEAAAPDSMNGRILGQTVRQ